MQIPDNIKVSVAGVLGVATPASNWFLDLGTPILNFLLLVAQLAVASVTAIYIYAKWRNLKGDKGDKGDKGEKGDRGDRGVSK
jgi:hypothetical protein